MSTLTTIVLSPLSETTVPWRSWRRPNSLSGFGIRVIGLRSLGFSRLTRPFVGRSERGRRLRFGFGVYHDASDVDRLLAAVRAALKD